jgi:predicted DsbA family dithiol-disulfide isomerase
MNAMREVAAKPMVPEDPMGFTVVRVPFFLEPDYPTDPSFEETNRVRLIRKWGGKAGWDAQKRRHGLKERGLEVGIPKFNLDRIASNTLASHRLVQWVTRTLGINAAETMYNSLNKLHFEDGQKLNNTAMLVEEAVAVGADAEEAREFLESEAGKPEIQAAQAKLRELGVSGIPTLILAGKWQMPSGAIGASSLVDAFRQLEEMGGGTGSMFAEALAIPDTVMEETLVL